MIINPTFSDSFPYQQLEIDQQEIGIFFREQLGSVNRKELDLIIQNGNRLPSGELTKNHGKSPFLMGKTTISMAIFNCYVEPVGNYWEL